MRTNVNLDDKLVKKSNETNQGKNKKSNHPYSLR